MSSNTRRPGFRLPWAGDTDEPSADAPQDGAMAEDAVDQGAHERGEHEMTSPGAGQPDATHAEGDGDSTATDTEPAVETSGFLASLVAAMRSVAEEARDTSLAEFRSSVESRVAEVQAAATQRADELRQRSEADISDVESWERSEAERIRAEARQRVEARRRQLDQELADHEATAERDMAAARERLDEHEQELAAFFAKLTEIKDPAAFVAAAKRMPRPPTSELGGPPAGASSGEDALNERLAALGTHSEPAAVVAPPVVEQAAEVEQTGSAEPEPAADEQTGEVGHTGAAAAAPDQEPSEAVATDAANRDEANRDEALAGRLAELDEQLAAAPAATPAPAADEAPDAETSTAIVVKGLGSFGAITSFKQALERVDGIRGVTLSLGPTGEFVYRASHAGDFDLINAIRSVEGEHAEIERSDGTIRVTVSRGR